MTVGFGSPRRTRNKPLSVLARDENGGLLPSRLTDHGHASVDHAARRWLLRMVRPRGPEAFVEFDADGLNQKVVVNYALR